MSTIPGREVDVTYGGCKMHMFLDMGVGIGGDKWPAAENFCTLITSKEWFPFFNGLIADKRVIELGSGNGLVGILLDKLFKPKQVIISDLASHMKHIEHNVGLNKCSQQILTVDYDWKDRAADLDPILQEPFDIILALEWCVNTHIYI